MVLVNDDDCIGKTKAGRFEETFAHVYYNVFYTFAGCKRLKVHLQIKNIAVWQNVQHLMVLRGRSGWFETSLRRHIRETHPWKELPEGT